MNRRSFLALLLVTGLASPIHAANAPVPMDPKVHDLLASTAAFYAAKKSAEVDVTSTLNIRMSGMRQEMDSTFHVALVRPNQFALILQSGMMGGTLVSNGKTSVTYEPTMHKYLSTESPADLSTLLEPMNIILVEGGLPLGFESFFRKDPLPAFQEGLKTSEDLGEEKLGEVQAHHIRLSTQTYITELWIADGAAPLLLQTRVSQNLSASLKAMTAEQKKKLPPGFSSMTMNRTTTYANWKFDQPVAAETFQFHPPADAVLVTEFVTQPPHPLVRKPAPDFTLNDLAGKPVQLSSLHGKIVVLDFWATWCGPCVATLPVVTKVASSFADKGVVFYAVNLKENADTIRKFQTEKSLTFPTLLDSDGKVANLYMAKSIPQTVVIDKDGKIQAVHVGYSPSAKQTLTRQLTDLIAGRQLTAPPAGK